jgi:hypothetical protein
MKRRCSVDRRSCLCGRILAALSFILLAAYSGPAAMAGNYVWSLATPCAPSCPGRIGHATAVFDNRLWILGGCTDDFTQPLLNDVWYSPNGRDWIEATANAPWPRGGGPTVVFHGELWIFSGYPEPVVYHSADGIEWIQGSGRRIES